MMIRVWVIPQNLTYVFIFDANHTYNYFHFRAQHNFRSVFMLWQPYAPFCIFCSEKQTMDDVQQLDKNIDFLKAVFCSDYQKIGGQH